MSAATRTTVLGVLLGCLLLTSCGASPPPQGSAADVRAASARVDVDTPALRQVKAAAGIAPCPAGTSSNQLPEVTLPCLGGGRPVDLTRLRGPMVVNLFAQWCAPCRGELPYFQMLHRKAKGTVAVLGVDYLDTQPMRALELARQTGVTYPLVADPAGLLRPQLKVRGLPGLVFVAADGTVSDVEFRVIRSYAELRALVEKRLGVTLPA